WIGSLPNELLLKIASYLQESKDLLNLSLTCKKNKEINNDLMEEMRCKKEVSIFIDSFEKLEFSSEEFDESAKQLFRSILTKLQHYEALKFLPEQLATALTAVHNKYSKAAGKMLGYHELMLPIEISEDSIEDDMEIVNWLVKNGTN